MKKVALHNLGCKVNAYETEAMQEILEQNGYEIVPFEEKADAYIVNTCSVTNMALPRRRESGPFPGDHQGIYAGNYDDITDAAIIVITAGANQKSGGGTPERYFCGYSHWK